MLNILKKALVVLLLSIIFISNAINIVKAAYEINEAYIQKIGDADYHLKYYNSQKGMYTYATCSIVGYYKDGKFYPAYCLNKELSGVGKVENYTVDVDSAITDNKIWRAVKNGYPYKTAQEMGLSSDYDAFAVTKFAIYCVSGQSDVNVFKADEGDQEGQAMLRALHNLVNLALNSNTTYDGEIRINQLGEELTEDGDYYYITYDVSSGSTIQGYKITSVTGLSDGDIVTDDNGNIRTSFNSNERFKIKISKNNLDSNKDININIEGILKSYPMFYGKTRIAGTQNYLLTANNYQNVSASYNTKLKLNNAKIKLVKYDQDTNERIPDTTFELYDLKGNLIERAVTDSNGEILFTDLFQGTYILKEVEANKEYVLQEGVNYDLTVRYKGVASITMENEHKKGNLTIYKVDKENNKLALGNIEFQLYSEETGNIVGTYYTDENGKIEIQGLRTGNYLLKETRTNKWYNLAQDKELQIEWNKTTEITVENELKKGQVKVIKVDQDNNEVKIPNVVFEVLDTDGNILETIKTDEQGVAYTNKYAIRDYEKLKLREVETGKYYKLNDKPQEVTLEENQTKTLIVENEKKKGQVRVIKVDKDNNEVKLAGVEFNVLDESGNIVDKLITDQNGEATSKNLPIDQKYTLQETKTNQNYVLSKDKKTVTLEENQISDIIFENEKKKGQIRVIKVDKDNNEVKLEGVEFNVLNKAGNIVDKIITDSNGEALTKRLPIDEIYTLQETKTNEKYILSNETKTVTLKENQISNIVFENQKIKGTIQIIKTTSDKSEITGLEKDSPLEGVVFEIYDNNGNLVDTLTTNKDGIARSKELEKGIYKVKEISTNEWYILDENYYTLEISTNKEVATLNIKNDPAKPDEQIEKVGCDQAQANQEIEYKVNVNNTGNVPLENFTWEDQIPTDYIRVTKIKLGTYNQDNTYNLYYKTNFSDDYILFLEDISTNSTEEIDFSKEISTNEYITGIKFQFKKVNPNFSSKEPTSIFAKVNSNVKRDDIFENKVTLTSTYNGYNINKASSWKTKIYEILPLTGM